jgi:hypothetical protein
LKVGAADVAGGVFLSSLEVELESGPKGGPFRADGLVRFVSAHVGTDFTVNQARFLGNPAGGAATMPSSSANGLYALLLSVRGVFTWCNVELRDNAKLDLSAATISLFVDQERSWPPPGNLLIDGLTYSLLAFVDTPVPSGDAAAARLRWLANQPPGYHLQPYRQLAKVLRESGDDAGATKVMIASADARYAQHGLGGRVVGWLLKVTIGYGHRPMLTILWSLAVVLFGWMVVRLAKEATVMRRTYPENAPVVSQDRYERLRPFVYSLDVFLPFVDLHQEHYWWPDGEAFSQLVVLGLPLQLSGALVLYYLWAQIIAGWILSAIFVAGVTGLIAND